MVGRVHIPVKNVRGHLVLYVIWGGISVRILGSIHVAEVCKIKDAKSEAFFFTCDIQENVFFDLNMSCVREVCENS
jgi:hypothetical protein